MIPPKHYSLLLVLALSAATSSDCFSVLGRKNNMKPSTEGYLQHALHLPGIHTNHFIRYPVNGTAVPWRSARKLELAQNIQVPMLCFRDRYQKNHICVSTQQQRLTLAPFPAGSWVHLEVGLPYLQQIVTLILPRYHHQITSKVPENGGVFHVEETLSFVVYDMHSCKFGEPPCMQPPPPGPFRFFLPPAPPHWLGANGTLQPSASFPFPLTETGALYFSALESSPWRTHNIDEATVIIPRIDLICSCNLCGYIKLIDVEEDFLQATKQYPGRNFLIPHLADHPIGTDLGFSLLAKSSWGQTLSDARLAMDHLATIESWPRPGLDVTVPLSFYRCKMGTFTHLQRFTQQPVVPMEDRQYLLTFKGAVYHDGIVLATPRRHLPALHNGHDVIILPLCSAMTRDCATGEEIPHTTLGPDAPDFAALCGNGSFPGDYDNLLTGSAFVAVLPGEGSHSYRLYEAMQAGAIPVILGDTALPFPELINWDAISVIARDTSLSALHRLELKLRSMPVAQRIDMQRLGQQVFYQYFSNLDQHVNGLMETLSHRVTQFHSAKAEYQSSAAISMDSQNAAEVEAISTALHSLVATRQRLLPQIHAAQEGSFATAEALFAQWHSALMNVVGKPLPDQLTFDEASHAVLLHPIAMNVLLSHPDMPAVPPNVSAPFDELDVYKRAYGDTASSLLSRKVQVFEALYTRGRDDFSWHEPSQQEIVAILGMLKEMSIPVCDDASALFIVRRQHEQDQRTCRFVDAVLAADGMTGSLLDIPTIRANALREVQLFLKALRSFGSPSSSPTHHDNNLAFRMQVKHEPQLLQLQSVLSFSLGRFREAVLLIQDAVMSVVSFFDMDQKQVPPSIAGPQGLDLYTGLSAVFRLVRTRLRISPVHLHANLHESSAIHTAAAWWRPDAGNIRIASLCDYPINSTSLGPLSITNHQLFADMHGHQVAVDTEAAWSDSHPGWSKISTMMRHLPHPEWLLWLDCDSFLFADQANIQHLLVKAHRHALEFGLPETRAPLMIMSEDGVLPNTGVVLLRNCPETMQLLQSMARYRNSAIQNHPWWDQAAFHYAVRMSHNSSTFSQNIFLLPQADMNPYPLPIASNLGKFNNYHKQGFWRPDSPIVSFSGCKIFLDRQSCETLFQHFASLAVEEATQALKVKYGKKTL